MNKITSYSTKPLEYYEKRVNTTDQGVLDPDKKVKLKALEKSIKACRKCPNLNVESPCISLAGQGNPNARLMLIGQSPCELCAVRQKVFYKGSGEILDIALRRIDENRDSVFITNVCKCHTPRNRPNKKAEIDNCRHFLEKEIEIIKPKIIVTLGKPAAQWFGISSWFKMENWRGYTIYAVTHPAFIIRNPHLLEEYLKNWDVLKIK